MATKWDNDFDQGFHGRNKPKNYRPLKGKRPTLARKPKNKIGKSKPAKPSVKDVYGSIPGMPGSLGS